MSRGSDSTGIDAPGTRPDETPGESSPPPVGRGLCPRRAISPGLAVALGPAGRGKDPPSAAPCSRRSSHGGNPPLLRLEVLGLGGQVLVDVIRDFEDRGRPARAGVVGL